MVGAMTWLPRLLSRGFRGRLGSMTDDPERERLDELIVKVGREQATEAEREELALYLEDHPEIASRLAEETRAAQLGKGWLERVEADRSLQARETTPFIRTERAIGVGLIIGGAVLGMAGTLLGPVAVMGGLGLLGWSFARVRLKTYKDDPYKDIKE